MYRDDFAASLAQLDAIRGEESDTPAKPNSDRFDERAFQKQLARRLVCAVQQEPRAWVLTKCVYTERAATAHFFYNYSRDLETAAWFNTRLHLALQIDDGGWFRRKHVHVYSVTLCIDRNRELGVDNLPPIPVLSERSLVALYDRSLRGVVANLPVLQAAKELE